MHSRVGLKSLFIKSVVNIFKFDLDLGTQRSALMFMILTMIGRNLFKRHFRYKFQVCDSIRFNNQNSSYAPELIKTTI